MKRLEGYRPIEPLAPSNRDRQPVDQQPKAEKTSGRRPNLEQPDKVTISEEVRRFAKFSQDRSNNE